MRNQWILTTLLGLTLGLAMLTGGDSLQAQTPPLVVTGTPYVPVPSAFTYQGRLTDGASLAHGVYDFQFTLHTAETGGWQVGPTVTREGVSVNNGLFTLLLDFGLDFLGQAVYLQVGVRPAGSSEAFTLLTPRQLLTATPYALALPGMRTQPNYESPNVIGGHKDNSVAPGVVGATIAGGGKGGQPNQVLDNFSVIGGGEGNVARGDHSLIGGGTHNLTQTYNNTIGGGANNSTSGLMATVAGGSDNQAHGGGATVGGGLSNQATASVATISGGNANTASATLSTVGGGGNNSATARGAVVAGGGGQDERGTLKPNTASGMWSTVSGGLLNTASGFASTVAGGGGFLTLECPECGNHATAPFTTVSGGNDNRATAYGASVVGGSGNRASAEHATVGGGSHNEAAAAYATIAGGGRRDPNDATTANRVTDQYGVIGGGGGNQAGNAAGDTTDAMYATVSGGSTNTASAPWATVGGGAFNGSTNYNTTVAGGQGNSASGLSATVAGGFSNNALGSLATVGGGSLNNVEGVAGTVAGGRTNTVLKDYGTVAGGEGNVAFETHATVGGGYDNSAAAPYATTSGGANNITYGQAAVIGGGYGNRTSGDYATVGGGKFNQSVNLFATIPGGLLNTADAPYSLAAGSRAHAAHRGALLLADSSGCQGETCAYEFASEIANEFAVRAIGGVRLVSAVDATGKSTAGVKLPAGAGAWSTLSDRQAKTDFAPVHTEALLEGLAQMPITTWRYKTEASGARHVGPTAEDFQAAFGMGSDSTHISTVDADGVALAAAQALYARTQRLETELAEAQTTNAQLAARVTSLETRLARLEGQTAPPPTPDYNLARWGLALVGGIALLWSAARRGRVGGER
ncbi:MAG: tail fiber domain-containing protein [Anaerolineae bacterium]|nr:tail fiber domain-containing protein [Anaerolineae bacterium]